MGRLHVIVSYYAPSHCFHSTSFDTTTTPKHNHPKPSSSPHTAKRKSPPQQVQKIMNESKTFLDTFQTLDVSHRGSKLLKLLLDWGPLIPNLIGNTTLLRQAVEYTDSLAHVYLDLLLQSECSKLNDNVVATSFIHPALHGWAKVQRHDPHCDAALKAETLLKRLLHVQSTTGQEWIQPQIQTYNSVLDSFSKSASPEAPDKARFWLKHMQSDENLVSPDRISYNCVMNVYATRGDAINATTLFEEMKQQQQANPKLEPDKYSYSIMLKAWQRSGSPKAPTMTVHLLEELKHKYFCSHARNKAHLAPNNSMYTIPMSLVRAHKAHVLLQDMLTWYQRESYQDLQPQTRHFALVMNAYAKEGNALMAEQIFMQMMELNNRAGYQNVQPNLSCFTILIKAWSKQQTPESIRRVEAILNHMEELFLHTRRDVGDNDERMNAYGYNSVMSAHVRSGEQGSAHRVQELFDRMTRLSKQHNNPEMLPDRVSYTTLMQAWIQERDIGFAERVEQLLNDMSKAFQETRRSSLKPDVISYGCAIDAWSKSGEPNAANRAETLLRQMQRLYEQGDASLAPNDTCFNSIINTHSKAGNAEQAELVLRLMEESYRNGNKSAKADAVTYSSCIDAWARSESVDAVFRSQAIFATMVDRYEQGDTKCKPSAATFASLMKALAISGLPDVARLAKENLRVLQELGVPLNTIAYNALIHACSCATGGASVKYDALELAMTTFHTMRTNKGIGVDFITYNSLLHVVSNLIADQDERQNALEDVFRECRKDNKVDEIFLATMKRLTSPLCVERLLRENACIGETSQQ